MEEDVEMPKMDSRGGQKAGVRKKTVRRAPRLLGDSPLPPGRVLPPPPPSDDGWYTVGKDGRKAKEAKHLSQERRAAGPRVGDGYTVKQPRHHPEGQRFDGVPVHRQDRERFAIKEHTQPRNLTDDKLIYTSKKNHSKAGLVRFH